MLAAVLWLLLHGAGARHHARAAVGVALGPRPPRRHGAVHHCNRQLGKITIAKNYDKLYIERKVFSDISIFTKYCVVS